MKTVGIVAEYNPFHNGHKYHIEEAKRTTKADFVVVIMSGNFVQRGTPAIIDKYSRAKMALSNGADLVFELPIQYSTATAEIFTHGAISLLQGLGFVDYVCFGGESTQLSQMNELAQLFQNEPNNYKKALLELQKEGLSFPTARTKAALQYFKEKKDHDIFSFLLSNPNNILGIGYLQALLRLHSSIEPIIIKRTSSQYHSLSLSGSIASATAIRKELLTNTTSHNIGNFIPKTVQNILFDSYQKTYPITEDDFSSLLYFSITNPILNKSYPDISEDFMNKLKKHINFDSSFTELANSLKSKDIVYTRICRNLLHLMLNISFPNKNESPSYLRLLGFKKTASHLLNKEFLKENGCNLPIITKTANAKKLLSPQAFAMFSEDMRASHLYYHICYQKFGHSVKSEYQQGPIIL